MSKRIKAELWARHGVKPQHRDAVDVVETWRPGRHTVTVDGHVLLDEDLQTPEAWARVWKDDRS